MKIIKPRLTVGQTIIDRYKIRGEIGQGGMQQVYRAYDLSLKRDVALKVPISHSGEKRFERSARLSANVVHPNIAKTLDYAKTGEFEFLIEELIPGKNLQERLDDQFERLDPHVVAHVMHHLSKAVSAMNERHVIHRDLKPSNIMVSDDMGLSEVKVTDFGVATMAGAEINEAVRGGQNSIAASKTVVGALAFMAPELIKRADNADRSKCDVWSIGSLLYFLLFREYPFGNELAAIQNILSGKFPNKKSQIDSTGLQFRALLESLWEITTRCLNMSVKERPTASQISSEFARVVYSTASRKRGRIDYLNPKSGAWGFIDPDDRSENVFFHYSSFFGGTPSKGMRVMYADFPGRPQARAFPVVACKS